ncbi:hypothetical protein RQP46_003655 [Phenoliferia psychrophenolica]
MAQHFAMSDTPISAHPVPAGTSDAPSVAFSSASQNGAPQPTLGQLPPELKALIVAMVAWTWDSVEDEESDDEDEDEDDRSGSELSSEHRHKLAGDPLLEGVKVKSTLWALALLDREFSGLVQQHLWKDINLTNATLPDIGTFLLDIVPRRGQHVELLALQLQGTVEWDPLSEELSPGLTARWESLEEYPEEEEESRILRFRRELLAELVPLLPNLARVEIDYFDADERDPMPAYLRLSEVADALARIGHQITHLVIDNSNSDELRTSEGHLAFFLLAFPNLIDLTLMIPLLPNGRVLEPFATAPLTTLIIDWTPSIAVENWSYFIVKHSSTLKDVTLLGGHEYTGSEVEKIRLVCSERKIRFKEEELLSDNEDYSDEEEDSDGYESPEEDYDSLTDSEE